MSPARFGSRKRSINWGFFPAPEFLRSTSPAMNSDSWSCGATTAEWFLATKSLRAFCTINTPCEQLPFRARVSPENKSTSPSAPIGRGKLTSPEAVSSSVGVVHTLYCASVTFSNQSTALPSRASAMAMCVMAVVGLAPCLRIHPDCKQSLQTDCPCERSRRNIDSRRRQLPNRVESVALRQTGAACSGATNPSRAPVRETKVTLLGPSAERGRGRRSATTATLG